MSKGLATIRRLYGLLLHLFPRNYRHEYGEELQAVFHLTLEDASGKGALRVANFLLRELVSLPKALVLAHLRERSRRPMIKKFGAYLNFAYGSYREFFTAMVPFFFLGCLLPLMTILTRSGWLIPQSRLVNGIGIASVVLLGLLGLSGIVTGLPRWSLPYLGFLLSILSVYLFSAIFGTPIYFLFRNFRDQSILIVDILWDGIFWYGLLFAVFLLVVLSRVSPAFRRFRHDWTLLNFILYGAAPFALLITFDDYVGDEPYIFLAFAVLAGGAWLYLRSNSARRRFGALFVALMVAMLGAAAGKALLVPTQDWPIAIDTGLARSEAKHTIIMWGWFALGMLIPLAAKFLPRSTQTSDVSLSEG